MACVLIMVVLIAINLGLVYIAARAINDYILRVIIKKIIETKIEIKVAEVKNNGN